jgi:hypothetical protein
MHVDSADDLEPQAGQLDQGNEDPDRIVSDDADDAGAGDGQTDDTGEDDAEEVEHEGRKYRIPKAIQAERMMQADYTQKTMALADQRRSWETERQAAIAADGAIQEVYGKVHALKAQVAEYAALDWAALNASDPTTTQSLFFDYQRAKDDLDGAEKGLAAKVEERGKAQATASATAMRECGQVLATKIPGWSGDKAKAIADFARTKYGVTNAEIAEMADPRMWVMIHDAMTAKAGERKAAGDARQAALQKIQPAAKPGGGKGGAPPPPLSDRAGTEAWMKARNAQLAKQK